MKKSLTLFATLAISAYCALGQGLNYELGFNPSYDQWPSAVLCTETHTYFVVEAITPYGAIFSALSRYDTLGNEDWTIQITPELITPGNPVAWVTDYDMSIADDVILAGHFMPGCDVGPLMSFVRQYDQSGQLLWAHDLNEIDWMIPGNFWFTAVHGSNDGSVKYNRTYMQSWPTDSVHSAILTVQPSGVVSDSIVVGPTQLEGLEDLDGYHTLGFKEDSLFGFDGNGTIIAEWIAPSGVGDIEAYGQDSLLVLLNDSVIVLDNDLEQVNAISVPGFSNYSTLKVEGTAIRFISSGSTDQHVLSLNEQLQMTHSVSVPVQVDSLDHMDFSGGHFVAGIEFDLAWQNSARIADHSLINPNDDHVNTVDVEVSSVQIYQTDTYLHPPTNYIYSFNYDVAARVVNHGDDVLNSVRLNCYRGLNPACGYNVFTEVFSGLNIAPGDSQLIDLGWIGLSTGTTYDPLVGNEFCVYSSHPNGITDLHVENDSQCVLGYSGPVGIQETVPMEISVYPNPASEALTIQSATLGRNAVIEVADLNGRSLFKGQFSNGTDQLSIDISRFPSGVYILKYWTETQTGNTKFVKL